MKINSILLIVCISLLSACATTDHLAQGMIYVNQQDYSNAINEFKAEVTARPSATAYANLGAAYMKVGKNNLALDALKKGENLDSRDTTLTYNLTSLYSLMDKVDLSLIYLDKTLANGFDNYDSIRFDPDLANLRGEPEFRTTLEKYKIFIQ